MPFDNALDLIKTKYKLIKLQDEKNDTSRVRIKLHNQYIL